MSTLSRGLLLSFDGLDCSGKETQVKELSSRLRYAGFVVRTFATPDYRTPSGEELKKRLQNKLGRWDDLPWRDKLALFARNRLEHRAEVVTALRQGELVIYDRYVPSSLAFMAIEAAAPQRLDQERDVIQQAVISLEYGQNRMPTEDFSIFLDVPPLISDQLLKRRKARHGEADEYTDRLSVQERLYNEYDLLCGSNPTHYLRIKCVAGSELLDISATSELIWDAVTAKFPFLSRKTS